MLVHRVLLEHWPVSAVALAFGVSERTVYKWLARYRAEGAAGLRDRRSVAHRRPHALCPAWLALIRLLRQAKLVAAEIAARLPLARSTVSAALSRLAWVACATSIHRLRSSATNGDTLASWCTWTPRSSAGSCAQAIGSPAIPVIT